MKEYAYSFAAPPGTSTLYDLIGNVTHESVRTPGGDEKHVYRAQVKDFSRDKWFIIQDLIVEELEKERMHLAESYIQVTPGAGNCANDRFGNGKSGLHRQTCSRIIITNDVYFSEGSPSACSSSMYPSFSCSSSCGTSYNRRIGLFGS